jgi:hypothetical protein
VIDLKRIQAASNEVVRGINRRIVLNLVRTRQPISRADLARVSGMQRSTISLIVEELVDEHWLIEGPTGRLPRGRRPTFLRLNEERAIIGKTATGSSQSQQVRTVGLRSFRQIAGGCDPLDFGHVGAHLAEFDTVERILAIAASGSAEGHVPDLDIGHEPQVFFTERRKA